MTAKLAQMRGIYLAGLWLEADLGGARMLCLNPSTAGSGEVATACAFILMSNRGMAPMLGLLIVATIVDLVLAALLAGVSVLLGPAAVTVWAAGLIACIAAPLVGFVLRAFGKPGTGVLIALMPPIIAALLSSGIVPGY